MKRTVKERARKVLELAQRCAKAAPEVRPAALIPPSRSDGPNITPRQVLDGDGLERTENTPEERGIAAASNVLLKNEGGVLPLKPKVRPRPRSPPAY